MTGGPGCTGPDGTPKPGVTVASGAVAAAAGGLAGAAPTIPDGGAARGAAMRGEPLLPLGAGDGGPPPLPGRKLGGGVLGGGMAGAARGGGGARIATWPGTWLPFAYMHCMYAMS